jgi:hypothetical protein
MIYTTDANILLKKRFRLSFTRFFLYENGRAVIEAVVWIAT